MSIYSGFPTRDCQAKYNKLVSQLIQTLQSHILEITDGVLTLAYCNKYNRLITKMKEYEEHKYLPPKFTVLMAPMSKAISNSISKGFEGQNNGNRGQLHSVKQQDECNSSRNISPQQTQEENVHKSLGKYHRFPKLTQSRTTKKSKQQERCYSVYSNKNMKHNKQSNQLSESSISQSNQKRASSNANPKVNSQNFFQSVRSINKINKIVNVEPTQNLRPSLQQQLPLKTVQMQKV